ncbi:MAG: hypothetical protein PHG20_09815 [Geobacteraceae bacterium]|nr:hypothetical protein [Geobacteraceae bacterium]
MKRLLVLIFVTLTITISGCLYYPGYGGYYDTGYNAPPVVLGGASVSLNFSDHGGQGRRHHGYPPPDYGQGRHHRR